MENRKYTFEESMDIRKRRLRTLLPWVVTIIFAVNLIGLLGSSERLSLPGASTALFLTAVSSLSIATLATSPLVIRRLGGKQKKFVWAGSLVAFLIAAGSSGNLEQAHKGSPAGALVKKEEELNKIDSAIAEGKKNYIEKLESCFGSFNSDEMPKLSEQVKASLHNPEAFEHIETSILSNETVTSNVRMRFRAENGFSAIRTASVDARIDPDDCSVVFIGEPEIEK